MDVSIIIASNRGCDALRPCLESIARQCFPLARLEVLIGFNGLPTPPDLEPRAWPFALHTRHIPAANVGAARNQVLAAARGEWLLLLNDDVALAPDAVTQHLAAQHAAPRPALVLGSAAWRRYPDETLFDRLVQTTSLIFFYDQMRPRQWYGFRHAWTLNLSVRRDLVTGVPFDERLAPVNFDDLEWAWRLHQRNDLGVWYEPAAACEHDHRYTPQAYLRREALLGVMAARLWHANPACFVEIFGRPLDQDLRRDYEFFVRDTAPRESELTATLARLAGRPASSVPQDVQSDLLAAAYEAQRPLKRLVFRRALLAASASEPEPPQPACVADAGARNRTLVAGR